MSYYRKLNFLIVIIILSVAMLMTGCNSEIDDFDTSNNISSDNMSDNNLIDETELINPELLSLVSDNKYTTGSYTIEIDSGLGGFLRFKFEIEDDTIISVEVLNDDLSQFDEEMMLFINGLGPLLEGVKVDDVQKFSSINGNSKMADTFNIKFEKFKTTVLIKPIENGIEAGSGIEMESGVSANSDIT